jgi:hypothetical protein
MLDNALINLIATQLEAASAQAGWSYPVIQKNQPTQEGIPTGPTIFFEKLFDMAYGWPEVSYEAYDPGTNTFQQTEKQWTETTFQVSALVIQDPTNLSLPTASDVVNYMKLFTNSRASIRTLKAQGVSMLRITAVRNPYFRDERHTFEANPNFDVVLQHQRIIVNRIGATDTVVGALVSGFEGQGTFPVPD